MTPKILIFTLNHEKPSSKTIHIFLLGVIIKVSRLKSCLHGFHSTGHKPVICNYTIPQCMINEFKYGDDDDG